MLMGPELTAGFRSLNDSAEPDVRYARAMAAVMLKNGRNTGDSIFARSVETIALANRGHLRAALDAGGTQLPQLTIQYLMLGVVPPDSADRAITSYTRSLVEENWSAMAWWAGRGDTASIKRFIQYIDSVRRKPPPPPRWPAVAVELTGYLMKSGPAYLALARRDTTTALGLFEALPDSLCFGACPLDPLVRAELLAARGRNQEAAQRLDAEPAFNHRDPLPTDVLWSLEKGRVNERLKNTDVARDAYADVIAHWAHGDTVLQPYVIEAREGLKRLSSEKKN